MNSNNSLTPKVSYLALTTAILLLIPFIAMQFSAEVQWSAGDFILAGALLFGTGLSYLFITQRSERLSYQFGVGLALFAGLFLIWTNLAVGIIGSESDPFNVWYFAVIGVGITGALVSRFKPIGLAFTMLAMILALISIVIVALSTGMHHNPISPMTEILGINGLFVVLFAISGLFFRYASEESLQIPSEKNHNIL